MFLKKYDFLNFCFTLFFIYNVHLSNCHPDDRDSDKDPTLKGSDSDDAIDPNDIMAKLDQMMQIDQLPLITVAVPLVVFEGVDYDLLKNLSEKTYNDYYDCFYWHTRCIRDGTYFHTVCAYGNSASWVNFANKCQLDLENCRHRVRDEYWKPSSGIFGSEEVQVFDSQYIHFYNGDGHDCKYYKFRRQVPDDRVNFYFENDQDAIEMEEYYGSYTMTNYD